MSSKAVIFHKADTSWHFHPNSMKKLWLVVNVKQRREILLLLTFVLVIVMAASSTISMCPHFYHAGTKVHATKKRSSKNVYRSTSSSTTKEGRW